MTAAATTTTTTKKKKLMMITKRLSDARNLIAMSRKQLHIAI